MANAELTVAAGAAMSQAVTNGDKVLLVNVQLMVVGDAAIKWAAISLAKAPVVNAQPTVADVVAMSKVARS